MHKQTIRGSILVLGCSCAIGASLFAGDNLPVAAQTQTCIPLRVIGGQGETTTRKRISSPGVAPGVNNNWNTDFAVPAGRRFTSYIATLTPENAAPYNVAVNLKFSDNTSREIYKRDGVNLQLNRPYQLQVNTPQGLTRQPYQVNLLVSGTLGNTYQARVSACQ